MKYLNRETIAYLICGGLTTLLSFGIYFLFARWGVITANVVSTLLAVIFAYVTNKRFVFQSTLWHYKILLREFITFSGGRLATFFTETALLVLLVDILHLPNLLCKCLTSVLVVVGNYFISKFAVFIHPKTKS